MTTWCISLAHQEEQHPIVGICRLKSANLWTSKEVRPTSKELGKHLMRHSRWFLYTLLPLAITSCHTSPSCHTTPSKQNTTAIPYLQLTTPRQVLPDAQPWEGDQFPHTLSVLDLQRDGFRY